MFHPSVTYNDQEKVDDFIQYRGSSINWNSENGFHTLMQHLETMKLGIRIEDHDRNWKVFIQDPEGALIGIGSSWDQKPYTALVKAVVAASLNNPVGYGPAFK